MATIKLDRSRLLGFAGTDVPNPGAKVGDMEVDPKTPGAKIDVIDPKVPHAKIGPVDPKTA